MGEPGTVEDGVEKTKRVEDYLPIGYPTLLFHGTSLGNSEGIASVGLGRGTLTTKVTDCFGSRFYRERGGALLFTRYKPDSFETKPEFGFHRLFWVGGAPREERDYVYTNVDTDGVHSERQTTSTQFYIEPGELGCCAIQEPLRRAISLIFSVIDCDSWLIGNIDPKKVEQTREKFIAAGIRPDEIEKTAREHTVSWGDEHNISLDEALLVAKSIRQEEAARLLGFDVDDFLNEDAMQLATNVEFTSDGQFIDRIVNNLQGNGLLLLWNNTGIDKQEVLKSILLQMYQTSLWVKTQAVFNEDECIPPSIVINQGESARNYFKLINDLRERQ